MPVNLNDAEYFADTIAKRVEQMINERDMLRRELDRRRKGTLDNEKAFIKAYQDNIIDNAMSLEKITKLERILMLL